MPRFVDIPVGSKFKRDGGENDTNTYIKIPDERINCCKVNNAALASDMNQKLMMIRENYQICWSLTSIEGPYSHFWQQCQLFEEFY